VATQKNTGTIVKWEKVDRLFSADVDRKQAAVTKHVKKLKEHGDDAKIEWMVSSEFLRNMKRVHIYIEPSRRTNADIIEQYDTDSDE
jgi:hypothetical protein